jgi:hypothetical protein
VAVGEAAVPARGQESIREGVEARVDPAAEEAARVEEVRAEGVVGPGAVVAPEVEVVRAVVAPEVEVVRAVVAPEVEVVRAVVGHHRRAGR